MKINKQFKDLSIGDKFTVPPFKEVYIKLKNEFDVPNFRFVDESPILTWYTAGQQDVCHIIEDVVKVIDLI